MASPFAPLKFLLPYLNSTTPKTLIFVWKKSNFLHSTEIGAIFVYFCPNLVAIATPLAPLKFLIAYLILPTPKILLFVWKNVIDFCTELKLVQFLLIFAQICCNGNSLGSLEISGSIYNFADPENITIRVKKSSIFCAELNSVQFLLIIAQIWLPWQLPWLS